MITDDPRILKCYTPNFISELAQKLDIQELSEIELLRNFLFNAAIHYLTIRDKISSKIPSSKIRAQILSIRNLTKELNLKLSELSGPADELIWTPQRHLRVIPFDDTNSKSPFGHTITRDRTGNIETINYLKENQIKEAIEILQNLAEYALPYRNKGGRPKAEAILIWVFNAQRFWEITLGRKFTHSSINNISKSMSYMFCLEALYTLDPAIKPKALVTAMRDVIRLGHIEIDKEGRLNRITRKNRPKK